MTIRGEIRSKHVPQHVDALAAAGVCADSFIVWKNSPGACQSFIAADQLLIESVGNPRCARMPTESVVGDYRVYVDLTLNSRRPDFANRMIPTIPLGVLVGLASIPTVLPGDYAHADQFVAISRLQPFLLIWPHSTVPPAFDRSRSSSRNLVALDCTRCIASDCNPRF